MGNLSNYTFGDHKIASLINHTLHCRFITAPVHLNFLIISLTVDREINVLYFRINLK